MTNSFKIENYILKTRAKITIDQIKKDLNLIDDIEIKEIISGYSEDSIVSIKGDGYILIGL